MTNFDIETRRAIASKASATKGALGHKVAGIKASITRLERLREALTGYDKGLVTKKINAKLAEAADLGIAL